ncbi:MAG TPA: trypsin-like peptidase domain-containing protein [Saprospiraceae bacterium]|nr:trypsin-like peptidase domain-containing protein [Saprospiraceae bacterium]
MRLLPHLVTGLLSICIALGLFIWYDNRIQDREADIACAPDMISAAEKGFRAVVSINAKYDPARRPDSTMQEDKSGSGVLISPDGDIVTNFHVVSHTERILVTLSNTHVFQAQVTGTDSLHDIALIKIHGHHLPFLEFGDSDSLQVGQSVIAVGNPHKLDFTVTSGIISALNRDQRVPGNNTRAYIQTDVPINSGNSGGPLLNAQGQLVGITGIMITVTGQYEGYSLATPSNIVRKIANDLGQFGKLNQGSLGISIRPVTHEIAEQAGMQEITGVVVDILKDGGAADKAGVKSLDIILSANGRIAESTAVFLDLLVLYSPGDTLHLIVNRDGREFPIDVSLQEPSQSIQ